MMASQRSCVSIRSAPRQQHITPRLCHLQSDKKTNKNIQYIAQELHHLPSGIRLTQHGTTSTSFASPTLSSKKKKASIPSSRQTIEQRQETRPSRPKKRSTKDGVCNQKMIHGSAQKVSAHKNKAPNDPNPTGIRLPRRLKHSALYLYNSRNNPKRKAKSFWGPNFLPHPRRNLYDRFFGRRSPLAWSRWKVCKCRFLRVHRKIWIIRNNDTLLA